MTSPCPQRPFPAAATHHSELYVKHRALAQALLCNGGTQPSGKAVTKATLRLLRGKAIKGSWRSWPREKPITLVEAAI